MQKQQIILGIIGGSLVLLMLGIFLLLFLLFYQRKHNAHIRERSDMRREFEDNLTQTRVEVQEQTRRNLAVDLHDNIGQILSLTSSTLASIDMEFSDRAAGKIADARDLVMRSIQELRRLSKVLHGQQIIQEGLLEAIQKDVEWLRDKGFYTIQLDIQPNGQDFGKEEANLFIYRIFQESLGNILRHAQADTITVFLSFLHPLMYLTIGDNGKGFDRDAAMGKRTGMGLNNMKKRTELLGGTMELDTAIGKGSILTFKIPYSSFGTDH